VIFGIAAGGIFGVSHYAGPLNKVVERKGIDARYQHDLIELRPDKKEAVFKHVGNGEEATINYDMIHVTPPMSSPDFISNSPLAAEAGGWVDVHPGTMQHVRYDNVFSLGDCSSLPTSKTGAAIRKQAPALAKNLMAAINGMALPAIYDGYTSCPLVTGYGSLILYWHGMLRGRA